jgi:hypothetical protein
LRNKSIPDGNRVLGSDPQGGGQKLFDLNHLLLTRRWLLLQNMIVIIIGFIENIISEEYVNILLRDVNFPWVVSHPSSEQCNEVLKTYSICIVLATAGDYFLMTAINLLLLSGLSF